MYPASLHRSNKFVPYPQSLVSDPFIHYILYPNPYLLFIISYPLSLIPHSLFLIPYTFSLSLNSLFLTPLPLISNPLSPTPYPISISCILYPLSLIPYLSFFSYSFSVSCKSIQDHTKL